MGIRNNGSRNHNSFSFRPSDSRMSLPSRFVSSYLLGSAEWNELARKGQPSNITGDFGVRVNNPYDLFLNERKNKLAPKFIKDLQPIFSQLDVDLNAVVIVIGTQNGNPSAKGMKITLSSGKTNYATVAKEIFHELGHVVQYVAALNIDPTNGARRFQDRYNHEKYLALQSGHLLADQIFDEAYLHIMYDQPVELKAMDLKVISKFKLLNPYFTLDAQCNRLRDILWEKWKLHFPWPSLL